jgi:glycerol-3-phosphate acyltransferase PlsY
MTFLFALFSYLLGSIPSGYILFRLSEKKDIRKYGSESIGATNVLRTKGWKLAIPVAVIDIVKGFLPAFIGLKMFGDIRLALLFGFCAVVGHCFPVFLRFKGGKGVATTAGAYAAVAFLPLICMVAVFVLIIAVTRYVSLGSILAVLCFPLFVLLFGNPVIAIYLSFAFSLLIIIRHQKNIQRLVQGKERRFGEKIS